MKRFWNMMRFVGRPLVGLLLIGLIFSACKKNDYTVSGNTAVAGLMAFNLSIDKTAVGFTLSGNQLLNAPLGYTSYTGAYLPIYPGTREVRTFDYVTGSTLAYANADFTDSMYYSAFLLGANGNYRNLVVNDQLNGLTVTAGKAWVRYINAIPDSSSAPLITVGGEVPASTPYGAVSSFTQVNAGSVNTSINNGTNISANRTLTLEENKAYTLLFVGIPNPTDTTRAVQIRFIENGTITP